MFILSNQKGAVSLIIIMLVISAMLGITATIFIATSGEQKILGHSLKSVQAYYAAESGLEDALLRLQKDLSWSSPYSLEVGSASTTITISDIVGGSRTLIVTGDLSNHLRTVAVTYEITADDVSFNYGAQAGDGGVVMANGSTIEGNLFSNGSVDMTGSAEITGTAIVAQNGNYLKGGNVGEDAHVDYCEDVNITGKLYLNSESGCTAAATSSLSGEIATTSLPITDEQINEWKDEALAGGTITGNYIKDSGTQDLGPIKIEGDMTIQNTATLYLTGTVWVTGTITIENSAEVRLHSDYDTLSGVLLSDDVITLQNLAKALGTGETGSYLLLLSTYSGGTAITIQNNFEADILFANNGEVVVANSTNLREVTAYKLSLANNTTVVYETGLASALFTSGPGGSWTVTNWREIE